MSCSLTSIGRTGRQVEPEVYPRPDGSVYVCGEPQSSIAVPACPSLVTVEQQVCLWPNVMASNLSVLELLNQSIEIRPKTSFAAL